MSKLQVIDLFSGAGGLSYGFEEAGYEIELAIEKDAWAVDTYKENHINHNIIEVDITQLDDSYFQKYKGKIDIVMGGPPCQGFSIAASNRRKKDDIRNTLYQHFLRVVDVIQPKAVLIENVKEIVGYKLPDGTKIIKDIERFFIEHEYVYDFKILNCRNYGIPQDRKRFFFLAVRKDLGTGQFDIETMMERFIVPEITFEDAVSDLPIVRAREYEEGAVLSYTTPPRNDYQKKMRGKCKELYNHIPMQHTSKTVQKFEFLLAGNKEPLPDDLKPRVRSHTDQISDASYGQNHRIIDASKVSPTITASFYSSFIHPSQPRNLTVREAARIQTFPDCFRFMGKKTTLSKKLLAKKGIFEELHLDQFNQVGNAVPPLMANHLADLCKSLLLEGNNR